MAPDGNFNERMMKAPGRGYSMPRNDFEENPKDYFLNLRNSKAEMEEEEKNKDGGLAAAAVAVAGVAALAAWGISKLFGSSEPEPERHEKMMKAPGRDCIMPRKDFEESPKDYFRNLRGKY